MRREDLEEIHNIVTISNVRSIMTHGILSHNQADRLGLRHESVANESVQRVRRRKRIPGGLLLHDYACLYLNARNPMMYVWKERHAQLCVLRISVAAIDLPGAVISDINAARNLARFREGGGGLENLDREMVFAEYWTHEDPLEKERRKGAMCAEVLVPQRLDPSYIIGAYVSCEQSRRDLTESTPGLPAIVNPHMFFRGR